MDIGWSLAVVETPITSEVRAEIRWHQTFSPGLLRL